MSVESKAVRLGDVELSHYLFDESPAEVTDPRIHELAQECLSRLEEATNMPLIVTDQAGPVERLRSVFLSVMSENTPPPTAAQRGNLAEYYVALKTQKNEELRYARLYFWKMNRAKYLDRDDFRIMDYEPFLVQDYDDMTGNEIEVAFREWVDKHPECLNKTSITLTSPQFRRLPPEIGLFKQLKHLTLENTCVGVLPPEIGNLTELESLEIDYHYLRTLPVEIGNLKKLKSLQIYDGQSVELKIPSEVGNLSELKYLNLRNNRLENVAVLGGLPQLEFLDIRETEIEEMDPVLAMKLSRIKVFRTTDALARQINDEAAFGQLMAIMHLMGTMQASSPINVDTTTTPSGSRTCTNQFSSAIMNFIPSLLRGKNPFAIL